MLEIIVPATSANIGPGFDCIGIALNLYNKFYFEEIEKGIIISGCESKYNNENNLVYKSMEYFFDKIKPNKVPKGIKISIDSNIPISRGLGSSASCIVAGVVAANYLSNSNLDKSELLQIASEIEGHPDNVAPALFGNMVVSILDNNKVYYDIIKLPNELNFCAMIPSFRLSTEESRAVLPKMIPYKDGIFNISRVSLLVSSMHNKNFDLLKFACEDKLHQDYRGKLIDNYYDIVKHCKNTDSLGVFLSGAGPTIMAMFLGDNDSFVPALSSYLNTLSNDWQLKVLSPELNGATVNILS